MLVRGSQLALVLVAAAAALFPAAAAAQNAGDEQYADPFGPVQQAPDSGEGGEQPPPVQGQTEAPAAPQETASAAPQAITAQATDGSGTLPRTGFDAWLVAAAGWWALLGGVALRRVLAT